ncbi:hypothetical protein [Bradyrhizobium sp. BR 1432]|uniref:hypothetical protein n=1 Tax=Bradyrhizobium sp. BR 1432 TaxID=3447966 RepID=UPI003EE4B130
MFTDFAALLLVSLVLAVFIVCWAISWVSRSPATRYWPLDIHLLNSSFFLLLDFQFLLASQYESFRIGEQTLNCSDTTLLSFQFANAIIFCVYAALLETLVTRKSATNSRPTSPHGRVASVILFLFIGGAVCGILMWSIVALGIGGLLELVGARQYRNDFVFLILNASPFVFVACLYVIFYSRSLAFSLIAVFISAGVAILSGGRGNIVSAFLLLVCAFLANGRPLNPYRMAVFGVLPLILLLQAYTTYIRYAGFQKVERGQDIWFGEVVESETFAIWKSVYAVSEIDFRLPYPLYSLSASLFFPVPRSIAPFKPEPPSTVFTKVISPVRFENTGSEITLSGVGTLMAELGFAGAILFGAALAAVSALQYRLSMKHNRQIQAFVLYFFVFSFWRSDLFTASRVLWTFLFVTGLFLGLRLALSLLAPQSSERLVT